MGLQRLTTSPLVLDLADLKDHLRIDNAQDDATLDILQRAAIDYIERAASITLGLSSYKLTIDAPAGRTIKLPKPPSATVQAVQSVGHDGTLTTLDPSTYTVRTDETPGRIVLKPGSDWTGNAGEVAQVIVTFTAGYEPGNEPEVARHLIRLLVGSWFEQREASTDRRYDEVPFAASALLPMLAYPEVF